MSLNSLNEIDKTQNVSDSSATNIGNLTNASNSNATSTNNNNNNNNKHKPPQSQQPPYLTNFQVKREPSHRVFVNRSLQLSKIKFFGFDMDYTLALYKSPQYEILAFNLVIDKLIKLGYPEDIKNFVYDPTFPVRGLWYDKLYGNLLKVDTYGNILICVHGFKFLKSNEIYKFYPNKYINFDESRVYFLNTLFSLPEIYLLACLINYFTSSLDYEEKETGVSSGDIFISYKAIFQDVRYAVDFIHGHGDLKKLTVENIDHYVVKDDRLATLFNRMHENNAKVFLLTNSGYEYTDKIMSFLLDEQKTGRNWRTYFDYILVDAQKPLFFAEGTSLKEINTENGIKKFGSHSGPLKPNQVYSGGSCDVFSKLIGSRGKDVLYVGDHIFGDIIKSKKERAWRTFLVVPELAQELSIWHDKRGVFSEMERLDKILAEKLIDFDSSSKNCPNISSIKHQIQKCIHEMDMQYGLLGSLFRSGSRQTHFASQATRYADIYAASHLNLLHYPFFYLFKAPPMLMPHESTVNPHEQISYNDDLMKRASRSSLTQISDSPSYSAFNTPLDIAALTQAAQNLSNEIQTSSQHKDSVESKQAASVDDIFAADGLTGTNNSNNSNNNSKAADLNSAIASAAITAAQSATNTNTQTSSSVSPSNHPHPILSKRTSVVVKPEQPVALTHHEDLDDDDEDSDESKNSESPPPPPTQTPM